MNFLPRRSLPHDIPPWVESGGLYFFTLCAHLTSRRLTDPATASALLNAVKNYHHRGRWYARLFLLMPDHLHALIAFPRQESLQASWRDWKRYTAKQTGVTWQRDWFEHRLGNSESSDLKAAYIRENPVRRGLVEKADDWSWRFAAGTTVTKGG